MKKLEDHDWWEELLSKKDDHSLRELSEMFGCSAGAINNALKRNGITRTPAPPGRRAGSDDGEPRERELGGPRAATAAKLAPFDDQLGKTPDVQIAEMAGVTAQTVARYRRSKGIPSSRSRHDVALLTPETRTVEVFVEESAESTEEALEVATVEAPASNLAAYASYVGKLPDNEIAQMAGVTVEEVERLRLGDDAPPVELPDVVPSITDPGRELYAYKVGLAAGEVFAIAHDLVDLAAKMEAAGREVQQLERLGAVLV